MTEIPSIILNTHASMPFLGLGTYKATEPAEAERSILSALDHGYRLIDTASVYKTEEIVGRTVRKSGIPRNDLFITTKVWNTAQRIGDIEGAFQRSLERLQMDYVDLYLIHWPVPGCYPETWRALERIYASGQAKAIGVSNFSIQDLEHLAAISNIIPAVNQIEYHPLWDQSELRQYCQQHGIVVQAYAPLARGAYLNRDTLVQIGEKYSKNPAQVGLRWLYQKGICSIPKSVNPDRVIANADIFDFELNEIEMKAIDALDEKFRSSGIPEDLR